MEVTGNNFVELMKLARTGKAILFCGAGASLDSINLGLEELPTVNPLLEKINTKIDSNFARLDIAASKLLDKSKEDYYNLVTETYRVRGVSEELNSILSFPWDKIYTTNYDNSLEISCEKLNKEHKIYTQNDEPSSIVGSSLPIIHLHGFVNNFRIDTIEHDCILDYNSNVANSVYEGAWATEFKNDVMKADIVVFLGYSLYDPEIAKILLRGKITKRKVFFINSKNTNEELEYMQSQFGMALNIEKDGLATVVSQFEDDPREKLTRKLVCFDNAKSFLADDRDATYQDMNDLFLFGRVDQHLLQADIVNKTNRYIIRPTVVDNIIGLIEAGKNLVFLVSPLGQGKSILSRILAIELSNSRDVFIAKRNQPEFLEEFEHIVKNFNSPVVILDDYYKYIKVQSQLARYKGSDVTLILTARQNVFDNWKGNLPEIFLNHEIESTRIGELTNADASALVPLVNQAGLWGENSSETDQKKAQLLMAGGVKGFQANFADILIGLMSSNEMIARIQKELEILKVLSADSYACVLFSLYLEFTNNHVDEFIVDQALDYSLGKQNSENQIETIFRIFFNPEGGNAYFSGSIFAKYAIQSVCNADDLLSVIKKSANNLSGERHRDESIKMVLIDLLRFNYLKLIAANKIDRLEKIRDYYSDLSSNPNLNHDDLFWNAFGMCERQLENFDEAIRHFRTGINYSKNRGANYVPYHAQNQLIVCLLERGVSTKIEITEAFNNVIEVSKLLLVQANDEREYGRGQAFKWHSELIGFLDVYYQSFTGAQKARVLRSYLKYIQFIKTSVTGWQNRTEAGLIVGKIETFFRANPLDG